MLKRFIYLLFLALLLPCIEAGAQVPEEYALANRLMRQQQYEQALPFLQELVEEEPQNRLYSDQLIECYIQLKRYEDGISLVRSLQEGSVSDPQLNIRLGELFHFMEETEKATQIWKTNLQNHPKQLQLYINTGQTMIERQEYLLAIDVYKMGRREFKNEQLFFGDIANAYLRAGEYESAINEWLNLLMEAPNQAGYIKRTLLRYDDPILNDITILELDERLESIPINDPVYNVLFNLQIWLLQENELYRRALVTAREYENTSSSFNYALFNLGRQLRENKEFELAVESYTYYIQNAFGEIRWRSMHELSNTYARWARYLDDYNLERQSKRDSLYILALNWLDTIENQTKNYSRMNQVYTRQAELSLDYIFNFENARTAVDKLRNMPGNENFPEINYLEGRLHLAKKEYPEARIQLTKANKKANVGDLAEKTRYFLALTDFYSGDYEFAKIQLKTLGRQNTSYYANDALELRLWLQEGLSADSAGTQLDSLSAAIFNYNNGNPELSTRQFLNIIQNKNMYFSLRDDALLFYLDSDQASVTARYSLLNSFLQNNPYTPVREKLLWEKARLSELLLSPLHQGNIPEGLDVTPPELIYEKLILSYPQGFYAPYARKQLTEIRREQS